MSQKFCSAKVIIFLFAILAAYPLSVNAQTLDLETMSAYSPSTARRVFEVAHNVHLDPAQQQALARAFQHEDSVWHQLMVKDGGLLTVGSERDLARLHEKAIASVLDDEQQRQYWRGVYDKESQAEANAIVDHFKKEYGITDQNAKFIRVAFYKYGLDSRVNNKMLPPKQAKQANEKLRRQQLKTIEKKGDIRVNDDMTLTVLKPFDPNSLHK